MVFVWIITEQITRRSRPVALMDKFPTKRAALDFYKTLPTKPYRMKVVRRKLKPAVGCIITDRRSEPAF